MAHNVLRAHAKAVAIYRELKQVRTHRRPPQRQWAGAASDIGLPISHILRPAFMYLCGYL